MSIISILTCWSFGKSDRQKNQGLTTPETIERFDNYRYGPDSKWNTLDVYRPRNSSVQKLPVIIDVHGGGWVYGDKEVYQYYCMDLATRGFAVVNFTYRLAPSFRFPAALEDLNQVVQFVLEQQEKFGFDVNHIFLVGDSAGAHMASIYSAICTNADYAAKFPFKVPERFKPNALVLNCGVYDASAELKKKGLNLTKLLFRDLLGTKRITEQQIEWITPVYHITKDYPEVFVMTAEGDFLKEQPNYLLPVLDEKGIPYQFRKYGTAENPLGQVFECDLRLREAAVCTDEEAAFLKEHVR